VSVCSVIFLVITGPPAHSVARQD